MIDKRDMRDPIKLGEFLTALRRRAGRSRTKLSTLYDKAHVGALAVDKYDDEGKGIAAEQAAKYRAEFPDGLPTNDDPGGA